MTTNASIDKALSALQPTAKSQDPLDPVADELRIATRIKRYAEARYKGALSAVELVVGKDKVQAVRDNATKLGFKSERQFQGAEYHVLVSCNAPASRLDVDAFINKLVKAGIDRSLLEQCQLAATKQSAPATSFSVVEA